MGACGPGKADAVVKSDSVTCRTQLQWWRRKGGDAEAGNWPDFEFEYSSPKTEKADQRLLS